MPVRPSERLLIAGAVLLATLLAIFFARGFSSRSTEPLAARTAASEPIGGFATASVSESRATHWTLTELGAPEDPLPPARPRPTVTDANQTSELADTLARQVLAGTPESLPALITALQAAGIAIVSADNTSLVTPAEPWQGIALRPWEVRLAAAMVLPERTVTFNVADLAAVLIAAVPALTGADVERLIVDDIRALGESAVPTRRFFGRFLAALGRNAAIPYELATIDAKALRLDGLQASLILRRLAVDILMFTADKSGKKSASILDSLDSWLEPRVYAQGQPPCTLDDRTRTIMDVVALGAQLGFGGAQVGEVGMQGIVNYLESHGFPGAKNLGTVSAIASTLLAYAQFIATYAALAVEVSLDAPPLVRTKNPSPQTGERKELTAVVKMNVGNAQMLNCFRVMLNAVGLDFSLANDGPVKGAHVGWYGVQGFDQSAAALHGGDEAIVQFVAPAASRTQTAGNPVSSLNPETNSVTGDEGAVKIGVEGRGQQHRISDDASRVSKSAKVRVQVALKGADLFGDLQEAAGTAAGGLVGLATLPLSVLYRAQWASAGHYTFPVTDWREGPAEWSGRIEFVETTIESDSHANSVNTAGMSTQTTTTTRTVVEVTETMSDQTDGGNIYASLTGKVEGVYDSLKTSAGWSTDVCGGPAITRRMKNTGRSSSHGSGHGDGTITVSVADDGAYVVAANSEGSMTVEGETSGELETFDHTPVRGEPKCTVLVKQTSMPHVPSTMPLATTLQGSGRIDPKHPGVLSGSRTEEETPKVLTEGITSRTTRTVTWRLLRN